MKKILMNKKEKLSFGELTPEEKAVWHTDEIAIFREGYQANRDYVLKNPYQDKWGSIEKAIWNNGWEKARLDRLKEIEKHER